MLDTVSGQDAFGQPVTTSQTLATLWGSIEPLSGRELWQAQQVQADVTHRITIRWQRTLTPTAKHKLVYQGRTFNISSVRNIEENQRVWEIFAKEVV